MSSSHMNMLSSSVSPTETPSGGFLFSSGDRSDPHRGGRIHQQGGDGRTGQGKGVQEVRGREAGSEKCKGGGTTKAVPCQQVQGGGGEWEAKEIPTVDGGKCLVVGVIPIA